MSFGPIYAKIREMEERLNNMEKLPISQSVMSTTLSSDIDSAGFNNLLNECSINSSSIAQLYSNLGNYATKDELVHLATKGELATLATKDELVPLATKDELVSLSTASPSTNNDVSSHVTDYLTAISSCATKDELATLATATKDELVPLATKDELVPLATKDELATLATKDELVDLLSKFDNIINVIEELNARIDGINAKITA